MHQSSSAVSRLETLVAKVVVDICKLLIMQSLNLAVTCYSQEQSNSAQVTMEAVFLTLSLLMKQTVVSALLALEVRFLSLV